VLLGRDGWSGGKGWEWGAYWCWGGASIRSVSGQYQASIWPVSGQYREPVSGASIGQDRPGSARIGPPLNQRAAIAPWGPPPGTAGRDGGGDPCGLAYSAPSRFPPLPRRPSRSLRYCPV